MPEIGRRRFVAGAAIGLTPARKGFAAAGGIGIQGHAFIPTQDGSAVQVVDIESDRVVGALDTGLAPQRIALSPFSGKLLAIDTISPRLVIIDVSNGAANTMPFDFVPGPLLIASGEPIGAIVDPRGGTIVLLRLTDGSEFRRIAGLGEIRDLIFNRNASRLYVAHAGAAGIEIYDVASGRRDGEIGPGGFGDSLFDVFTISANTRTLYAREQDRRAIRIIDLDTETAVARFEIGRGAMAAYPTGFGEHLLVPDGERGELSVVDARNLAVEATFQTGRTRGVPYPGWFDTVLFLAVPAEDRLGVYDLASLREAGSIRLPGTPGAGIVTQDSQKLYIALPDARKIAVIDTRNRRLSGFIELPVRPANVVVAGGLGICH